MEHHERIYLDYGAATPLDEAALRAMQPYWSETFGNTGSLHADGVRAKGALERARGEIAGLIGAQPDEVIFTSGGTESNNLAVQGVVRARVAAGARLEDIHLVTTAIEHSSVFDCFRALAASGVQVTYVPVDVHGLPDLKVLAQSLRPETALVSVMYASNEIGTVLPLAEVSRVVRRFRAAAGTAYPYIHTDASQAFAWLPPTVRELGVDLMTIDAQKAYGPKGAGLLFKARAVVLAPLMYGGSQEWGLRPGTPNTPLSIGMAAALAGAHARRTEDTGRVGALRDAFRARVCTIPGAHENGHPTIRIANNANFSFSGLEGERIVLELDARGVSVSTRSACLDGEEAGSAVVRALGKGEAYATSAVRFTLGRMTTREQLDRTAALLEEIVARLTREQLT